MKVETIMVPAVLQQEQICFYLENFSALDRYFRVREPGPVFMVVESDLVGLTRIFDGLSYPGLPNIDVALKADDTVYYFRCVDHFSETGPLYPFPVQNFFYRLSNDTFYDTYGIYSYLRENTLAALDNQRSVENSVMESAILVSRYHYAAEETVLRTTGEDISPDQQRNLLCQILTSRHSERGLVLLKQLGFIDQYWPEIAGMTEVKHTKDYHPEGNVWKHTLEAMKHRKTTEITLSLALLLHDIGKTIAAGSKDKPFENHADIGASLCYGFLNRLGFPRKLIEEVQFLIKFHMLPGAIKTMPLYRIENILLNPLFPTLLELYRADMSATFQGPTAYYEACRVYKSFIKKHRNPFVRLDKSRIVLS